MVHLTSAIIMSSKTESPHHQIGLCLFKSLYNIGWMLYRWLFVWTWLMN